MVKPELLQLWREIETDLRAARRLMPADLDSTFFSEFESFLSHNELELAMEQLEEIGYRHPCGIEFWKALKAAATKMKLPERMKIYAKEAAQSQQ